MAINKDEVGILIENVTSNISILQILKFCGTPLKKYAVLSGRVEMSL